MRISAAIVGCGNIAGRYDELKKDAGCYTHAGAYRSIPEIDLVAAVDPDLARLAAFGRHWGVPHLYTDVKQLLDRHPLDLISVCVPDALHEEIINVVLATRPPKAIFAEKPLTLSAETARGVLDRARAAGTRVIVNNQRRWERGHQRVRAMIREGAIGRVVGVTALYVKGLYHVGATVIDTIRFLVGEVESAQALAGEHVASVAGDSSADAVLYLKNGATAVVLGADRYGYRYSIFEIDIIGTGGRIRLIENGDRIQVLERREYAHYPGFTELREVSEASVPADMGSAIPSGLRQIVGFLRGSYAPVENDGEEAYRDLCVADAIARSRQQGGRRLPVDS